MMMLNQHALEAAYASAPAEKRDMHLIASAIRAYEDSVVSQAADCRAEVMRMMREEFDPHPNMEMPAGEWDDNAEDVADKIVLAVLSESRIHISDAWQVVKKWLTDCAEEEAAFSRYRDNVMLDGVMTAGEMRKLNTALAFQCCKALAPAEECACARPTGAVTEEQEDAIVAAYMGICVLSTMCDKAGLELGRQRSNELLKELSEAFPKAYHRALLSYLRDSESSPSGIARDP
jgi:hypothetical protein